ncbi:EF-hand domain-containing protein [Plasmodiophora brassicae]
MSSSSWAAAVVARLPDRQRLLGDLRKRLHRRVLSLMVTRTGPVVLVVAASIGVVAAVHVLLLVGQYSAFVVGCATRSCPHAYNNIGRRSFQGDLCAPVFDVVYTWVNGSDRALIEQIQRYRAEDGELASDIASVDKHNADAAAIAEATGAEPTQPEVVDEKKHGQNRFRDNEELRYSLRSLWLYAPWVRNVYIVTNGQVPYWLDLSNPNVFIVTHGDIFPNRADLPVFSSPAIEVHLHRIPGLSDRFLYFNDDTMLGNVVWPDDFWSREGGQKVYLSWDVPQCNAGCPDSWLNDNYCDLVCNTSSCNYDEGDCLGPNINDRGPKSWKNSRPQASSSARPGHVPRAPIQQQELPTQTYCGTGCPNSWLGDKVCDRACKTARCGFDAGDCGTALVRESVHRYELTRNGTEIVIPADRMSAYVDMAGRIPYTITSAEHECELFMRSAIIIQSEKLLILVLLPAGEAPATCTVAITARKTDPDGGPATDVLTVFTLHRQGTASSAASSSNDTAVGVVEPGAGAGVSFVDEAQSAGDGPADPAGRALLWTGDVLDLEHVLRQVAVEGVPSDRFPSGVALLGDMNEGDWALAERLVERKREQLVRLAEDEVLATVAEHVRRNEREAGMIWPWQLVKDFARRVTPRNRRLLDAFGDSLRFVTRLYNAYFSVQSRKVPAHMPHMIDKNIVYEMQSIWPAEFAATSSHRFRSSSDIQFAFSYFYYMMERPERFDATAFFRNEIDLDRDGYVSEMELRHLTSLNRQLSFSELTNTLINCSVAIAQSRGHRLSLDEGVSVTEETVRLCPPVLSMLRPIVEGRKHFRHQKASMEQVTFYMVGDNATLVRQRLEEILVERKKFVCLNDDMRNPEPSVKTALSEFFEAYYPMRSPFELPPGTTNRFLYIGPLRWWMRFVALLWFLFESAIVAVVIYVVIRRDDVIAWLRKRDAKVKVDKTMVAF